MDDGIGDTFVGVDSGVAVQLPLKDKHRFVVDQGFDRHQSLAQVFIDTQNRRPVRLGETSVSGP